jgi:hypothetical protein
MSEPSEVQRYLDGLSHPRHDEITQLRAAILASDSAFSETIKWNAPNFVHSGVDRVTFRLHPSAQFQVVLHRGSAKATRQAPAFATDSTLVRWAAPDRGVIDVPMGAEFESRLDELVDLIAAWARS